MSDKEVLEERNGMRLVLEMDPYPEEPYDDGQAPLLRIDNDRYWTSDRGVSHIDGNSRPHDDDERIEEAARRWGASPSHADWKLFEKYLRAFYGVTVIDTHQSQDYWYVSYDSKAWKDYIGLPDNASSAGDLHLLDEWKAYVEGEVYTYAIEKLVTWTSDEPLFGDEQYTRQTWEEVDSLGSYYGHEYAEQAAREAWAAGGFAEQGGDAVLLPCRECGNNPCVYPCAPGTDDYPEEKTRKDLA
jgi:hypothetical protein